MKEFIKAIENVKRNLEDDENELAVVLWHGVCSECYGVDVFYGANVKRIPKKSKEDFDSFINKVNDEAELLAGQAKCKFVLVDSYFNPNGVGEIFKRK